MTFALHQKVIWIANDPDLHPMRKRIMEGTVSRLGRDTVYVNGHHKAEDQLYAAFVWPDLPGPRKLCEDILDMEARHKAEGEDMLKRTLEMNNLCVREGMK